MIDQKDEVKKLREHFSAFCLKAEGITHFQVGINEVAFWGAQYFLKLLQDNKMFRDVKNFYDIESIKKNLQLLPCYNQQLDSLLDILTRLQLIFSPQQNIYQLQQQGIIKLEQLLSDKKLILARHPELFANINFLHSVLERYLLILSGKESFLSVFFPNGSFDIVVGLYENSPESKYYNCLTASIIAYYAKNYSLLQGGKSISVLEIGAGIGSLSRQLLPLLDKNKLCEQYHYTDISSAFLGYGRYQFKENFDFITFSKFDINKVNEPQGFQKNYYDIIFASNVVHNARNITKTLTYINTLLRPGGMVIFNEGITKNDYSTLIYGLSIGWWTFTDPKWRIPGTPLIDFPRWQKLFSAESFRSSLSLNQVLNLPEIMSQDIVVSIK